MPYFAYRGRNARGEMVRGVLEGSDSGVVAEQLINSGVSPIDIAATKAPAVVSDKAWFGRMFAKGIVLEDLLLFSRQMYTLLRAGVPILRALTGLQESATTPAFAQVILEVKQSLDAGRELNVSLRRHPRVFSPFYVSMVRVGEFTGRLDEVFLRLYGHLEFERDMRERVTQAMRYPLFVIFAMVVALFIVNIFVIPAFAKLFAGFKTELPLITRGLLAFSNFMVAYWPSIVGAAGGAYIGFRVWTGTVSGRYSWDKLKLRLPISGKIILKATLARFSRALAISLKSGVPVVQALSVCAPTVDNAFITQRVEQMRDGVERGESLRRTATTTGVFTPVVVQMISVGEEAGELDDMLAEVADMYQREVEYELKTLSSQIEPILIIALGVLVLLLALGVFLPIWELGQAALGGGGR